MTTGLSFYLDTKETGDVWLAEVLPKIWPEICREIGLLAGVVVLREEGSDVFAEVASFGYGEEGFYYSFMQRDSVAWREIFQASAPKVFSQDAYPLYAKDSYGIGFGILCGGVPLGFLLVEAELDNRVPIALFLSLLADKISREWERKSSLGLVETMPRNSASEGQSLFRASIRGLPEAIRKLSQEKILALHGKAGVGKKTLAKWMHQDLGVSGEFLVVESLPESFGKWEKALQDWGLRAASLVLVLEPTFGLGHQQILVDWWKRSEEKPYLFLVSQVQEFSEIVIEFARLLQKNSLTLPSWSELDLELRRDLLHRTFQELGSELGRSGLTLGKSAEKELLARDYPRSFSDVRNQLKAAILKTKGPEILRGELLSPQESWDLELPLTEDLDLRRGTQALERQKILLAMRIFSGNQIRMAKALGISRGSLQYKMEKLGL